MRSAVLKQQNNLFTTWNTMFSSIRPESVLSTELIDNGHEIALYPCDKTITRMGP